MVIIWKRWRTILPAFRCAAWLSRVMPRILSLRAAASDKDTLIAMATHGRSGVNRFLLGSVAEKVLRGAANPLLLVRAPEARTDGEAVVKSVIVPLDGSALAENDSPGS